MTRTAKRPREKLTRLGLRLPCEVHIKRTYAGRNQRSLGAWS